MIDVLATNGPLVDTFDLMDLFGMILLSGVLMVVLFFAVAFLYILSAIWLGLTSMTWLHTKPDGRDTYVDKFILILRLLPLPVRRVLWVWTPLTLSLILLVATYQVLLPYKRILDFHLVGMQFQKWEQATTTCEHCSHCQTTAIETAPETQEVTARPIRKLAVTPVYRLKGVFARS
jgi:hypothetical protein